MATKGKVSKKSMASVVSATMFDEFTLPSLKEAELIEYLNEFPISIESFRETHQRPVVAGCGMLVSFGEIIDAAEASDIFQAPIIEGKVWNVIKEDLKAGVPFVLRKPFVIGFNQSDCSRDENGMFVPGDESPIVCLAGGRHRTQAIYLMLKLSRFSDEEIRNMEVLAIPEVYANVAEQAQAIRDDNSSRTPAAGEKVALKLQELSIDLTDEGLAEAMADKSLTTAELVFSHTLKLLNEYKSGEVVDEDGEVLELPANVLNLQISTAAKLAQTAVSQVNSALKGAAKQLLKTPEGMATLVDIILNYLGDALDSWNEYAKKNPAKDVNNLQRNATGVVSSIIGDVVATFTETYEANIREAEEAKAQKRKEALAKARESSSKNKEGSKAKAAPKAEKSTSKRAAKKVEPVVEEEEVDENDAEEEVAEEPTPTKARRNSKAATAPESVKKAVKPATPAKSNSSKRRSV